LELNRPKLKFIDGAGNFSPKKSADLGDIPVPPDHLAFVMTYENEMVILEITRILLACIVPGLVERARSKRKNQPPRRNRKK
jgi:hypothetical protein